MMDLTMQKEQFSLAYVHAVAACAGYGWSRRNVDDDSVDISIHQRGTNGTVRSPQLDLQVKATAVPTTMEDRIAFPLKMKNYDDLRPENLMVPRLLVLVLVPENPAEWIEHTDEEMVMRRCGYYLSLRGRPDTDNQHTTTVHVPRGNMFSPDSLQNLMNEIALGTMP